jgi:hypothetical protein
LEKERNMSGSRKCPQCAELVQLEAKICRFCSYDFVNRSPAKPPKNSFQSCMTVFLILNGIALLLVALLLSGI